ncbi:(-)-germacrene D synthase-like isoform X2 [Aegilops tauschii subsp. strangulata]|uniref:(-)-germacrene D synthase-like isoform X2 n=1 Tax=Aegilops tauschii subsp. strangulata TaxID=200361 RepID=UPI001ABCF517|nr:(-)-germacrene D synthase-like isoform X2 [Aegilops tauschii subsp. strangulata]
MEQQKPERRVIGQLEDSKWTRYFLDAVQLPCSRQKMIKERRDELVQTVCCMIERYTSSKKDLSKGMTTVDAIERLGVGYLFEEEIRKFTDVLISTSIDKNDLAGVALRFRLLRQHHYDITCEEVLKSFKDENGEHFKDAVQSDVSTLLSLYEAAHLGKREEDSLTAAIRFTSSCLSSISKANQLPHHVLERVRHALATPSQRRMKRLEAKLYISIYEKDDEGDQDILELAKLDFHILQLMHRDEVKSISLWDEEDARRIGKCYGYVMSHLSNTLDQFVEDGASAIGIACTKEIIKHVSGCMLQEVVWRDEGHVPPVHDHLRITAISTFYWALSCLSFTGMDAGDDVFSWAISFPKIIENAAMVSRLMDDISGHECEKERSNVATAVDCYIKEHGVTVDQAKEALGGLVEEQWRSINEEFLSNTTVPVEVLTRVVNLARVMDCMYKNLDGYTHSSETADPIDKLLNSCVNH